MAKQHHFLKTVQPYFNDQESGAKPFEVRRNDRDFAVGDILHLQEFALPETYTGRELLREVTYVLEDASYCKEGFVVLGSNWTAIAHRMGLRLLCSCLPARTQSGSTTTYTAKLKRGFSVAA